jgi:DNA-binding transcriptional ArsR family regulator
MARIVHPDIAEVTLEKVLSALADPVRLKIVQMAANKPQPCNVFQGELSKSTLSHHMRILREAGIIRQQAQGTSHLTALRKQELNSRFPGVLASVLKSAAKR